MSLDLLMHMAATISPEVAEAINPVVKATPTVLAVREVLGHKVLVNVTPQGEVPIAYVGNGKL